MVTEKFPVKVQVVLDIIMLILSFATISVLTWQQFNFAIKSYDTHIFYTNVNLPQWPFVALFSFGYGVAALTILTLIIRKIVAICKGEWEKECRLEEMDPVFVFGKNGMPVNHGGQEEEKGGADHES